MITGNTGASSKTTSPDPYLCHLMITGNTGASSKTTSSDPKKQLAYPMITSSNSLVHSIVNSSSLFAVIQSSSPFMVKIFTASIRSMREGNVLTHLCVPVHTGGVSPSSADGQYPHPVLNVVVPLSSPDWLTPLPPLGLNGVPSIGDWTGCGLHGLCRGGTPVAVSNRRTFFITVVRPF